MVQWGMPKTTMTAISLSVEPAQLRDLKTLSEVTGAPVAELIRRAITMYLEERKSDLKGEKR